MFQVSRYLFRMGAMKVFGRDQLKVEEDSEGSSLSASDGELEDADERVAKTRLLEAQAEYITFDADEAKSRAKISSKVCGFLVSYVLEKEADET